MKKILVVDDEPHIVKMTELRLKANGYEVITAHDGQQGLDKARSEKPDLIILDIVMPYMDGGDVARALAEDDSTKDIPIIFLTALITKTEESLGIGITTGTHHIIAKPFEDEELLDKVKELLEPGSGKEEE